MRILVLGSSGFLGSYLGFALPRLGHEVFGVSRSAVSFFPKNRVASEPEEFSDLILSGAYDLVVNCVAVASHEGCEANPEYAHTVNAVFPGMWARSAQLAGAQFVQISTDAVFDGAGTHPYAEEDIASPPIGLWLVETGRRKSCPGGARGFAYPSHKLFRMVQ